MRIVIGPNTIVLEPITGEPDRPGRYLGMVSRYLGHQDGPGFDPVIVEWYRDGRTGTLWPTAAERGAIWTHRVTVEATTESTGTVVGLAGKTRAALVAELLALFTVEATTVEATTAPAEGVQGLTREETGHVLDAVQHVLTRAQIDADLGYHLGPLTQSFEKLVEAEATITGRPLAEVRASRVRSMTTDKPRVKQLEAQVYRLEAQLERLGAIPDGSPE